MARQLPIQGRFGYRRVHLVKSEDNSLGIGSYGAVYKARCDQLPCAAKVLHPILFSTRDPASRRIVERFEQECQFLSGMRHPNIIQYLGTCRDPESGLPVLLMELMDESLTSFLEQPDDPPPLPFHIQVNISLDVAQALTYLHSNEVLHRDLSSNNVLLLGSNRAKVTDFGMAKIAGNHTRHTPATFCPGTMGYMSPEALREPPAYTTKLDIFSCGVLHIQIITRKFPDPGPRIHHIEISDPRFPLGQAEVPVPERERRRSHIDLIDPTHPLLMIALECLKDQERERPSAEQLCSRLAALKESPRYQESLQQEQQISQRLQEQIEAQAEHQRELLQQNQELQQQLEEKEEAVQAKEREVDDLMRNMEQLRLQSERQTQEKEEAVQAKEREVDDLMRNMEQLRLQSERQAQEKEAQIQQQKREMEQKERVIQQKEFDIHQLGDDLHQKNEQVQQLRRELHQTSQDSEQLVATLQQSLKQKDEAIMSKEEVIRSKDATLLESEKKIQELRQSQEWGSSPVAQPLKLQWRSRQKAPLKIFGESSAVHGRVAYFYSWDWEKIMMYNSVSGKWFILPECPKRDFSISVINGRLTAIGGWQRSDGKLTKVLLSLTKKQKWKEKYPQMTCFHSLPAIAHTSTLLIVAGGLGPKEAQAPVEVIDTNTLCWSTVASLPHSCKQATATICGDRIYIAGGFMKGVETNSVLTCVVSELLQSTSTQHQSLEARPMAASALQPSKVWQEVAPIPAYFSSLVTVHGRLLAVGGCDSDPSPTSAVYQYNRATNSWKVISRMSTKRAQCFVAVVPDNVLLVAGGVVEDTPFTCTDDVEIAFCV